MKYWIWGLLLCLPLAAQGYTVGEITAESTRMSGNTLKRHFLMKPGEEFSSARYEYAQDELHKLRVFKKLDFTATPRGDKMDINIRADDGWYLFPMGFIAGGSKRAAGLSLAGGNIFKQGESTFLFVGGGKDGWTSQIGVGATQHFLNLRYTHLKADQRFYQDNWFNIPSVFSTADDKEDHEDKLLREVEGTQDIVALTYKYRFAPHWRAALRPQYKHISYKHDALDSGNHHQVAVGLEYSRDIRPGLNMGALSGYGLTDKTKSLQDLPGVRSGYTGAVYYTNGGDWTGSDYSISKLSIEGAWILELPARHVFMWQVKGENAFTTPFSDQVASTDLLSSGRYDRQLRGKRGAGSTVSFMYYLMRNDTGLLSITPFYELSYVDTGARYQPHSGAGASLMYRLWRFPLPFGLNYTHNLQDGSHQFSVAVGGSFR